MDFILGLTKLEILPGLHMIRNPKSYIFRSQVTAAFFLVYFISPLFLLFFFSYVYFVKVFP